MNPFSQPGSPSLCQKTPGRTVDATLLARAVRFFLCLVVVGLSLFPIVTSQRIGHFREVFDDLFEGRSLPALTAWVIQSQPVLVMLSFLWPVAAVATLFSRRIVGSLYVLGGLALAAIVQALVIYFALSAPLVEILTSLEGDPSP
jgi:hypothetical protein